jgi:S-adenosylmethionine/arginine decarboxylase-like enzyme
MRLRSLVVTSLGASLFSFFLGKLVRQVAPSMNLPKPAAQVFQKVDFVWVSSSEDRERRPTDVETHGSVEKEDDLDEEDDDEEEDEGEDSHYHLTMSLGNVSRDLIESELALFNLMEAIKDEFDLEVVAHGCQVLPHGATIRCLGILGEGHISLYAWPEKSVVLFDLFTQEEEVNIDDMKVLSGIFRQEGSQGMLPGDDFYFGPESTWAMRHRGDRDELSDYDSYMEDASDMKKAVRTLFSTGANVHSIVWFLV